MHGGGIMPITADYHLHTTFSSDGISQMEDMVLAGIGKGLTHMCFTEHNDYDYLPSETFPEGSFLVNVDSYLYEILRLREKYADRIKINFGVELGMQLHINRLNSIFAKSHEFDFIIASIHVCNGLDPYFPSYYHGRNEEEAYREYFTAIIDNIRKFSNFDVLGHIDYVVRYGPNKDREYTYEKYQDLLDTIIDYLIDHGKGLEINTGAIRAGLKELHPCSEILRQYRKRGGEIITIGSDAHDISRVADGFDRAAEVLKECGFGYYTIFENRMPEFKKLV